MSSLVYVLRDFADWCSLPGLIQLINALNAYVRAAWAIIWFSLWGVFIYELVVIIQQFLAYPASVDVSLDYKSRAFPMLTICRQNPLRYDRIKGNETYADILRIQKAYVDLVRAKYGHIQNDTLGVNSITYKSDKVVYLQNAQVLAMKALSNEAIAYAGYELEEFIPAYYFNNAKVSALFFNEFYDPTYGLCYQFNANKTINEILDTRRAGSYFGLRALVMTALPLTLYSGLRLGINYQNEDPAMENYGLDVASGTETMISLQMTEVMRAGKPYGDCTDDPSLNYYTGYNYTISYCFRSCVQKSMLESCGCADPLYAKPDNATFCTLTDLSCLFEQRSSQANGSTFSVVEVCGCRPACTDTKFSVVTSMATFPGPGFKVLLDTDTAYSCTSNSTLFDNATACQGWYRENAVVLNVYYEGLDYLLEAEGSAYDIGSASNDLGGQAGLWVGISLVNVVEGLVFFIFMTVYAMNGRKFTTVEITDELRAVDRRYKYLQEFKEELDTQDIMDHEIHVRYRGMKMRDELKRQHRLLVGMRLNQMAAAKDLPPPQEKQEQTGGILNMANPLAPKTDQ